MNCVAIKAHVYNPLFQNPTSPQPKIYTQPQQKNSLPSQKTNNIPAEPLSAKWAQRGVHRSATAVKEPQTRCEAKYFLPWRHCMHLHTPRHAEFNLPVRGASAAPRTGQSISCYTYCNARFLQCRGKSCRCCWGQGPGKNCFAYRRPGRGWKAASGEMRVYRFCGRVMRCVSWVLKGMVVFRWFIGDNLNWGMWNLALEDRQVKFDSPMYVMLIQCVISEHVYVM